MQPQLAMIPKSPAPPDFTTDAARHAAIRARDPRAEGAFFYSVATTGVYCRPTCAARPARPENVAFHPTADAAERAGFRPCKRCQPRGPTQDQRHAELVARARTRLEEDGAPIGLTALAAATGVSPYYLHRLFKKHVGMTPREYAAAQRLARVGEELREGSSVTAAIYEAGYSSSGRFYETGGAALGMPPSDLRRGGQGVEMRAGVYACSLGRVLIAATARGLCAVALGEDATALEDDLRVRFPRATVHAPDGALDALAADVVAMIDGSQIAQDLPLDLIGTAFQQRVWRALRAIPRGETATYGAVAEVIGAPRAVRAVGTACGDNPVAVVVPCHRVVREDGSLGGYRWGLGRKRALLARERAQ